MPARVKRGWHTPRPGWARRVHAHGFEPIEIVPTSPAPADSWWTRPQTRDEFDQAAAQRRREAGWVGVSSGTGPA